MVLVQNGRQNLKPLNTLGSASVVVRGVKPRLKAESAPIDRGSDPEASGDSLAVALRLSNFYINSASCCIYC